MGEVEGDHDTRRIREGSGDRGTLMDREPAKQKANDRTINWQMIMAMLEV
jgi:hypothetical protein